MPVTCTCTNEKCGLRVVRPCGNELFFVGNIEDSYPRFCERCGAPMHRVNDCNHPTSFTAAYKGGLPGWTDSPPPRGFSNTLAMKEQES